LRTPNEERERQKLRSKFRKELETISSFSRISSVTSEFEEKLMEVGGRLSWKSLLILWRLQ
jgi:hypothetical protein